MSAILAALINGALACAPLAILIWLVLRLIPRRMLNAATRYAVWWAALIVSVCLPLLFLPGRASDAPGRHSVAAAPTNFVRDGGTLVPAPASTTAGLNTADAPQRLSVFPVTLAAGKWPKGVLYGWLALAFVMMGRVVMSYFALRRRVALSIAPPMNLHACADRWLAKCGANRPGTRLSLSPDSGIPIAGGLHRPFILLPAGLLDHLDAGQLEHIGMHEAAHLARKDDYALLIERLIQAVFAVNPVVHWIARHIDVEREIACDDIVVQATQQPRSYAACLTRVMEVAGIVRESTTATAAAERRSHLSQRVELLLLESRAGTARLFKARLAGALVALAGFLWIASQAPGMIAFATAADKRLVIIPVIVRDPQNRFVTGLRKDNFQLVDNGVAREITSFVSSDAPASVAVVLNAAERGNVENSRESLMHFAELVMTANAASEVAVVRPDKASAAFSDNVKEVRNALAAAQPAGPLSTAIQAAVEAMRTARNEKKAMLVISDAAGPVSVDDELLQSGGSQVYTISISAACTGPIARISQRTAGRCVPAISKEDVFESAGMLALELSNEYLLGHMPDSAREPSIEVRLAVPTGLPPFTAEVRTPDLAGKRR